MTATPFETAGGLTSYAAGVGFLQALTAASGGRMAMQQVGTTVLGKPLWLIRLGATAAPAYGPSPTSAFLVATQHANEPQGWEGLIARIRDLAEAPTADELAYLTAHPLFILPCANPDNLGTDNPMNADGVNINRDHLTLATPEGETIQRLITDIGPQLVLDMHTGGALDMDVQSADAIETDPEIKAVAALARDHIISHLNAAGITSGPYVSSGTEPRMLWTAAGLRHAVGILTEVRSSTGNPATDPTLAGQIGWYVETLKALRAWHGANAERVTSAVTVSRMRAEGRGATAEQFRIGGTTVYMAAPAAYRLTPEQEAIAAARLASLGIASADGAVSMSQPARNYIPYVLDGRAPLSAITAAEPREPIIPAGAQMTGQRAVRLGGRTHPVAHIGLMVDSRDATV